LVEGHEAQVAVGNDADEHLALVDDWQAGDPVLGAQRVHLGQRGVRSRGHRIGDHAGLRALDQVDLRGLIRDRHAPVQDAETTLPGHRDRHSSLGDGVHC
jgi:hypothetical protein